jgi:hypothetical protein
VQNQGKQNVKNRWVDLECNKEEGWIELEVLYGRSSYMRDSAAKIQK